jgi:hypothetical protein
MEESYPAFLGYLMKESEIEMVAEMQPFLLSGNYSHHLTLVECV